MKKIIFSIFLIILSILGIKNTYAQIYGIDVSHYQGTIDWNAVANDGKVFAWVKASDGRTYTDSKFVQNMTNGQAAGVVMGAYHFARPISNSATSEANHFLAVAGNYIGNGFLPPVLDLEDPSTSTHLTSYFTSSQLTAWVQEWMNVVESHTGVKPVIYTSGSIADYLGSSLTQYGLWIADPDGNPSDPPTHIGHWNTWVSKQYSWNGVVSGINTTSVDLDVFHGSTQDFYNFISANTDPPENDECANAITLQSSENCNPVEGTVNFATHDNGFNPGSCDNYSGTPLGAGVFYKFVATYTQHTITVHPQGDLDAVVVLYHGSDCNSLQEVACMDAPGGGGVTTTLTADNLIVGDMYYIRVYDYGSVNASNGDFSICVTNPDTPTGPPNDECANAITLQSSVNCNPIDGTVNNATHDNGFNPGSCDNYSGTPLGAGVFYKFVATHTTHTITVDPQGDLDAIVVLYHGSDCNSLQEVACVDAPGGSGVTTTLTADNLVPGETYYIRVYDYGSVNASNGDFSICVTNPDTPSGPPNDECANAITLQSSVNCNPIDGTVNNATHDNGFNPGSCDNYSGTPLGAGVFYQFIATHTTHTITVDPQGDLDAVVVLYHGNDCNSLQEVACVDAPGGGGVTTTLTADNLTIGDTYYIRVYDYGSVNASNGDFSICVTNPNTPSGPQNDECANAITLQSSVNCNPIDGTVNNATHDNGFNPGSCDNYSGTPLGAGVFYKFVATNTQHTITVDPQGDLDAVLVLYHGTDCNSLQEVACMDAPGGSGVITTLTADNLTVGDTYYIRVYDYGSLNASNGDFSICVTNPSSTSTEDISLSGCELLNGNSFNQGSQVIVQATQNYEGNSTTIPPVFLYYYLSDDCTLDSNDVYLGSSVSNINANNTSETETDTLTLPANLQSGNYNILFVADATNVVDEVSENNNIVCKPITILGNNTQDIYLSSLYLDNAILSAGGTTNAEVNVNYISNSSSSKSVIYVNYYLSQDDILDSGDVFLAENYVNITDNNMTKKIVTPLTVPLNTSDGIYYVIAKADPFNNYFETNEDNNTVLYQLQVENSTYSGLENTYGLKIYPNPAKDLVAIESNKRIVNITVFNNNGKEVLNVKTNSTRSILDLKGLSNGNYLVKIKFADNNQIIEKIIKN